MFNELSEIIIQKIDTKNLQDGDILVIKSENITSETLFCLKEEITNIAKKSGAVINHGIGVIAIQPNDDISIIKGVRNQHIKVKKLTPEAILPCKGTDDAAGWDLFLPSNSAASGYILSPGELIKGLTNIAIEIPKGLFGMIQPRSSAFSNGLSINGVIDSDFRGEISLQIRNISNSLITLQPGKSYAQLILVDHNIGILLQEVDELTETSRGNKGFGSTGNI